MTSEIFSTKQFGDMSQEYGEYIRGETWGYVPRNWPELTWGCEGNENLLMDNFKSNKHGVTVISLEKSSALCRVDMGARMDDFLRQHSWEC